MVPLANVFTIPNCQDNLQDGVCPLASLLLLHKKQRQTVLIASTAAIIGNTIATAIPVLFLVLPVNKVQEFRKQHAANLRNNLIIIWNTSYKTYFTTMNHLFRKMHIDSSTCRELWSPSTKNLSGTRPKHYGNQLLVA